MELRKIHRGGERKASYVLTLPKDFLRALRISDGDYVSLSLLNDRIVLAPVQERKQREEARAASSPERTTPQAVKLGGSPSQ